MDQPIVQGLLTFLGGAVVAGLNALLSARLLDKKPAAFASFSAVRQLFNVAYLVLVFFGSRALGWDVTAPLVGAALGRAALSKSRKVFYTVGFVYQLVIFLMRLLPSTAANAILGKMYAE